MLGLMDFILHMVDGEKESDLWEMWLHKDTEFSTDFEKFKKKHLKSVFKKNQTITEEDENKAIKQAQSILKIGGVNVNG